MQQIFIAGVYVCYLILGLAAPFVFGLGYIWVDLFTPQDVAPDVLGQAPVALVLGAACFIGYLLFDRKALPTIGLSIVLLLCFAGWMTLTLMWAVAPDAAGKWNWAFKVVIFAAFMPFLFRSRIQIEAVLLTMILALSGSIMAVAVKTIITGGGYGVESALVGYNSGLTEGSTLSMVAVAVLPLIGFVRRHSLIIPARRLRTVIAWGLSAFCIITALGLFTRTGLVALAVYILLLCIQARRKILAAVTILAAIYAIAPHLSAGWDTRMTTLEKPEADLSAAARLAVWKWTLSYVVEHPLGGGFNAYETDELVLPDAFSTHLKGVAFHSIYFEILGEMGFVGFAVWGLIVAAFFLSMWRLRRRARRRGATEWLVGLTTALQMSVTVYLTAGAFVGVGFQPMLYYLFGTAIALNEFWRRSNAAQEAASASRARSVLPLGAADQLGTG